MRVPLVVRGCVLLAWFATAVPCGGAEPTAVDFERHIAPLLLRHCLACHNDTDPKGGLALTSGERLQAGGDSGSPIDHDDAEQSLLLQRVVLGEMPPPDTPGTTRVSEEEIAVLREWIGSGARWPAERVLDPYEVTTNVRGGRDWWSFRPVRRPPLADSPEAGGNPIDRFVIARLAAEQLTMAPPADRRTLARRLYFDLWGLPPTPEQMNEFLADSSPDAYERLVDRLLAAPQFGERWARHWLDVVRYADSNGYERDAAKPFAYKYRDWVIQSLNDDLPYDQFVIAQLAGDELADRTEQSVAATGMLRVGTWDDEPNDPLEYQYERLEDLVHVTSTAFLGLTVKCARCHDHKFDPIPQRDYYQIASAFWAGYIAPRDRALMGGPSYDELGFEVLGWTDRGREVEPLHILAKGDPHRPKEIALPAALSFASGSAAAFAPPGPSARTTQRRLQLAHWIVDKDNPLTARVIVNRIWQHHFGTAIVRSPDNFGFKGELPTHPELLDWLAAELMASGWQMKRIHRLILLSDTYRQASDHPHDAQCLAQDPENRWYWHANRRRLDAESLRDALLATSGTLNPAAGGPGFMPAVDAKALEGLSMKSAVWHTSPRAERHRRSIYMFTKRGLVMPLLTTFDFCDTTQPSGTRATSTVAPQALALMNNQFPHAMSSALAERVVAEVGDDLEAQIDRAWQLALQRAPTASEHAAARAHLATQSRRFREQPQLASKQRDLPPIGAMEGLRLWLSADQGVELDERGRAVRWLDRSAAGNHAVQADPARRPAWHSDAKDQLPALVFAGEHALELSQPLLTSQRFSIFAVVRDEGREGLREILSNWNREGNSVTSVFLGTHGGGGVRLSDDFVTTAQLQSPATTFLLTAIAGEHDTWLYQNDRLLAAKGGPLAPRRLDTPWVIGTQGNFGSEFWQGAITELIVFDRALSEDERKIVWQQLVTSRGIFSPSEEPLTVEQWSPDLKALASLCHVLVNTNEFIYVD